MSLKSKLSIFYGFPPKLHVFPCKNGYISYINYKKAVKGKRCGLESIDFMLNNKGTDLAFTLGDVDALTAKVFNQVDSGEFANFTSGLFQ